MLIQDMPEDELRSLLTEICETIGIGKLARNRSTIMTNIENSLRRSNCLSRIENVHTETLEDEDTGEPFEQSVLNWGHEPDQYEAKYREVVGAASSA